MMSPNEVVKKVAKLVVDDNLCYVHRSSREITTFDPVSKYSDEVQDFENDLKNYIKVSPMPAQALAFAMKDFVHEVTDQEVKKELINGLKRNNPNRNFSQVVESRFDIKAHWKTFKSEQCEKYVKQLFIDEYNY